jgi:hypothetical protein
MLAVALLFCCACGQTPPAAERELPIKGYGLSPRGFPADYSQLAQFFDEVSRLAHGGVMFNGAWRSDVVGGSDAGQIPQPAALVMQQAAAGYTPIIVFGWRSEDALHLSVPANPTNNWTNAEAANLFRQMLVEFASEHHPPYLFLGNENDGYYANDPEDYARWIQFYDQAYSAIKAASPSTMVGPIFQYERLSGNGAFSQWTQLLWGALDAHDLAKVDIVGITLYPWLGVSTPEEIPAGYLAPLLERIDGKPIAITETGWPGEDLGLDAPWEQSPDAQVRYVAALRKMLSGADIDIINWLFLNPMTGADTSFEARAFGSISLRDAQGEERPVYDLWVDYLP